MNIYARVFWAASACLGAIALTGCHHALRPWHQTLEGGNRFQLVMGGHAVLDKETGLVWERRLGYATGAVSIAELQSWREARLYCATTVVGGRKGWRLPSFHELASLVDPTIPTPGPALPAGHPFEGARSRAYWSATVDADVSARRWVVLLNSGNVASDDEDSRHLVWCVRGGGPITEY